MMERTALLRRRRKRLLKNRAFLKTLYSGTKNAVKGCLDMATPFQLKNLIMAMYYVCSGEVPFAKSQHKFLIKGKRQPLLYKLNDRSFLKKLQRDDRATKLEYVRKFTSLFGSILHTYFNRYQ